MTMLGIGILSIVAFVLCAHAYYRLMVAEEHDTAMRWAQELARKVDQWQR